MLHTALTRMELCAFFGINPLPPHQDNEIMQLCGVGSLTQVHFSFTVHTVGFRIKLLVWFIWL